VGAARGEAMEQRNMLPISQCLQHIFEIHFENILTQEAQLSPTDRAMRLVSSNLASYQATVQKLLMRQVLTKPMV